MILWILRGLFGIIIIGMATNAALVYINEEHDRLAGIAVFLGILAVGLVAVGIDVYVRNKQITTISAIYFGLLLGLLLGTLFSTALEPIISDYLPHGGPAVDQREGPAPATGLAAEPPEHPGASKGPRANPAPGSVVVNEQLDRIERAVRQAGATVAVRPAAPVLLLRFFVTVVCCYITVTTLLQTKDEFRFIIPYVEFSKQVKGGRPLVLDTSVIIDGRIADICDTRIIDNKLVVPRFVLQELQGIADSSDKLKRNRGRRGLDMLKRMQNNPKIELQMHEGNLPELRELNKVDERLVGLAKSLGARVVTNDYNLNKIAQLQGVEVINLNELANALKSVALPGETLLVKIVKAGDQIGQGVGYLDDGTMVVVEQGRGHIGHEVGISVTSVLQTPAGRMIFGRINAPAAIGPPPEKEASRPA
jgi:uncharacterized protein YacL